ncbi:MAG: DUF5711 family protein [Pseudoflavonifractor sp.]
MKEKQAVHECTQTPKKKPNILMRLLAFLVTLALVLGAVAVVVYRDKFNFDAVRRYFSYRTLEKSDSGQTESFGHGGSTKDSFMAVDGDLLVCSNSGVHVFSADGTSSAEKQLPLSHPITAFAGPYSLIYDAGGHSLLVYGHKDRTFYPPLVTDAEILSARLNPSGWLAVTTRATGYKGSVTVYGGDLTPKLRLDLSSSFVTDALVTADNQSLVAVTMGQGDFGFESRLALYHLNRTAEQTEPDAVCCLGSSVVLDLCEMSTGYCALGDTSLSMVGRDGTLTGTFDYEGRFLKEFSLGGEEFAAVLLGKYRAGTLSDLVIVDQTGTQTATRRMSEQVLSISAAGRYLSVLTADRLDIYTKDLELYSSLSGTQSARKVLQQPDGSALLIGSETARLYIPN